MIASLVGGQVAIWGGKQQASPRKASRVHGYDDIEMRAYACPMCKIGVSRADRDVIC